MPRLIWSPRALADIQRIYRVLANKNQDAASRAVKTIRAGSNILAQHPEIGLIYATDPASSASPPSSGRACWRAHIWAYSPSCASKPAWVPRSTILP